MLCYMRVFVFYIKKEKYRKNQISARSTADRGNDTIAFKDYITITTVPIYKIDLLREQSCLVTFVINTEEIWIVGIPSVLSSLSPFFFGSIFPSWRCITLGFSPACDRADVSRIRSVRVSCYVRRMRTLSWKFSLEIRRRYRACVIEKV